MKLNSIEEIIEDIRQGKMVILMDDEDRENEGDLIMASQLVRSQDINFMATHARGLICLTLTDERCEFLKLPLMVGSNNGSQFGTNFTVSIEAAEGVTTGISAADRAHTVQVAVNPDSNPGNIVQPGHIFPVMAQPGGVLRRAGHTEAGCDLARMAGLIESAVIVEIMNEDGSMARRTDLEAFAEKHQLKIGTIADLIHYRIANEKTVERISEQQLQTEHGEFHALVYRDRIQGGEHLALIKGEIKSNEAVLVRVHVTDPLRDLLGVKSQTCSWSLSKALGRVAAEGKGVVVLLDSAEDMASLSSRLKGDQGRRKPDSGAYLSVGTGSQILRDLGVHKMRVLSAPVKYNAISGFDLEIVDYIPCKS